MMVHPILAVFGATCMAALVAADASAQEAPPVPAGHGTTSVDAVGGLGQPLELSDGAGFHALGEDEAVTAAVTSGANPQLQEWLSNPAGSVRSLGVDAGSPGGVGILAGPAAVLEVVTPRTTTRSGSF